MTFLRRRLTYANVVATLALIAACTGTAWAAATITGQHVVNGSLTGADILDNSVVSADVAALTGTDVANRSLTSLDLAPGTVKTYSAGSGMALTGSVLSAKGSGINQVLLVAKSGGDFTTIQAAIDSISDASASKRYLVQVGAGTYAERITLKPFVTLAGAGEQVTTITSTETSDDKGTVTGAANTEIRDLRIENDGTASTATNSWGLLLVANERVRRVTAVTTGNGDDSAHAVRCNACALDIEHLTAQSNLSVGYYPTFAAVLIDGGTGTISHSFARGNGNDGLAVAILVRDGAVVRLDDVEARSNHPGFSGDGDNVALMASGAGTTVSVEHSYLYGEGWIYRLAGATVNVAASQVDGSLFGTSATCVNVWNAAFTPATCG